MVILPLPGQFVQRACLLLAVMQWLCLPGNAQSALPHPDSIGQVNTWLMAERDLLTRNQVLTEAEKVPLLLRYGLYEAAASLQSQLSDGSEASRYARALVAYHYSNFQEAVSLLEPLLATEGSLYREALQLRMALHIAAWELEKAQALGESRMASFLGDKIFLYWLGLVCFHQKDLARARSYAQQALASTPVIPEAYELLSLIAWWEGGYAAAGQHARMALHHRPDLGDARFVLGYSQWAEGGFQSGYHQQWALALQFAPFHEKVHGFLGSGYSPLSLSEYQAFGHGVFTSVQAKADSLWASGNARQALGLLQNSSTVQGKLHHASFQYLGLQLTVPTNSTSATLKSFSDLSKECLFYGPAHQGVAATLRFMKLQFARSGTHLPGQKRTDWPAVFPDLAYYRYTTLPDKLESLLAPLAAWAPLLIRSRTQLRIPALHQTIAGVLNDTTFLHGYTHDHRKWMDIRAVSTGATGVEWIDQGFYQGRNVLLHELVHLIHHEFFTRNQKEELALLFDQAKQANTLLDQYSSHSVYEFFAQGFTAYHTREAVHPVQPKEANTHNDLKARSPALYAFIDAWARAIQQGNPEFLRPQEMVWQISEVSKLHGSHPERMLPALEKALATFPCLYEAHALLFRVHWWNNDFPNAQRAIEMLEKCVPRDVEGVQRLKIAYQEARFAAGKVLADESARQQGLLYQQAWEATMSTERRLSLLEKRVDFWETFALLPALMENTGQQALLGLSFTHHPAVAKALAARTFYQVTWGGEEAGLATLAELQKAHPERLYPAQRYADALLATGRYALAIQFLQEMRQTYLQRGWDADWFTVRMAVVLCRQQQCGPVLELLGTLQSPVVTLPSETLLAVCRVLIASGQTGQARDYMSGVSFSKDPSTWSAYLFTSALLFGAEGKMAEGSERAMAALAANPYHWEARWWLMEQLAKEGKKGRKEAKILLKKALDLPYPPGKEMANAARTAIFSRKK